MISTRQAIQFTVVAIAGAVYLGMSYLAAASDHPPLIALLAGIIPLGAIVLVSAWHSRARALWLMVYAVCALAFAINLEYLRNHAAWLYFVQHAGAMTLLGITFGITLNSSHTDALCTRMASLVHRDPLDADYEAYTWKVTLAWTVFFAVSALLSVLLFFFGPIEAWSFFANLLTPILLGVMFVGEYLIRLRVLPNRTHFSIAETITAYREYSRHHNHR